MGQNLLGVGFLILVIAASYIIEYLSALPRTHGIAPTAEQRSAAHSQARLKVLSLSATVAAVMVGFTLAKAFTNT